MPQKGQRHGAGVHCVNAGKINHPGVHATKNVGPISDHLSASILKYPQILDEEPFVGWGFVVTEGTKPLLCAHCRLVLQDLLKEVPAYVEEHRHSESVGKRVRPEEEEEEGPVTPSQELAGTFEEFSLGSQPSASSSVPETKRLKSNDVMETERPASLPIVQESSRSQILPVKCSDCQSLLSGMQTLIASGSLTAAEKYKLLTCAPASLTSKELSNFTGVSNHIAGKAILCRQTHGIFSFPVYGHRGHAPLSKVTEDLVIQFYLRNDISNPSPNKTVQHHEKDKEPTLLPKRYILSNLAETYEAFCKENPGPDPDTPLLSISKFRELRPENCRWPGRTGQHEVCVCPFHENFRFLLDAIHQPNHSPSPFINQFFCNPPGPDCFLGLCSNENCRNFDAIDELDFDTAEEIEFKFWNCKQRASLQTKSLSVPKFKDYLKKQVMIIAKHHFTMTQQQESFKELREQLKDGKSVLVWVDFGENYAYIIQKSPGSFHWNNNSATIHPFYVEYFDKTSEKVQHKTFFVVSDTHEHTHATFHVFRCKFMELFQNDPLFDDISTIHFISDGSSSQYKNQFNFLNLIDHKTNWPKFTVDWSFSATSHGKSCCDGLCGVLKRSLRLASVTGPGTGTLISNIDQLYNFSVTKFPNIVFIKVLQPEILMAKIQLLQRYQYAMKIVGTRSFHFITVNNNVLTGRQYSKSMVKFDFQYNFDRPQVEVPLISGGELENDFDIGDFIAIISRNNFTLGQVCEINDDEEDTILELKLFKRRGKQNFFTKPSVDQVEEFHSLENLRKVNPIKVLRHLQLPAEEYDEIVQASSNIH